MASSAVQFWGADSVLKAFDSRDVNTWAIFQGKELITRGTGRETLADFLSMLGGGYSNAVYTLKIYEGLEETEVDDRTGCHGSFKFSLASDNGGRSIGGTSDPVLLARLAALEKKISGPEQEEETIQTAVIGLLKEPDKLVTLIEGFNLLMGRAVPQRAVAGIPQRSAGEIATVSDDERLTRLQKALDTLEKNDPQILEHLEKLAAISEKSPGTFQSLLSMLKNF